MREIKKPNLAEHRQLMNSPEARASRRAERLGSLAVHGDIVRRGRKSRELHTPQEMLFTPTISPPELDLLRRLLPKDRPIFDKFSGHYYVRPLTFERLDQYCTNRRRSAQKPTNEHADDSSFAKEREQQRRALQRQPLNIADGLLQNSFERRNIAKLRGVSLATCIVQIALGRPVDKAAQVYSADAVSDFGFCLLDTKTKTSREIQSGLSHFPSTARTITLIGVMGEQGEGGVESLRQNRGLLDVVLDQQRTRYRMWNDTFQFTQLYLADRRSLPADFDHLTAAQHSEQAWLDEEVARQQKIRK